MIRQPAHPAAAASAAAAPAVGGSPPRQQLAADPDEDDGNGGGGERGEEWSERPTSTSRQRVKQLLKRLKAENSAAGRGGLPNLCSYFIQTEAAGGNDRWIILLELADMCKRENDFETARTLYRRAIKIRPRKSQVWLEYAKMEEECGLLEHCRSILRRGLTYVPFCEGLMIKAIKTDEKLGNTAGAHAILARLKDQPLEKTWRTILEGALFEARAGRSDVARKVFHYLMRNVPWYGPIYQEAYRFEERCEEYERAMKIVEHGLRENLKYGPLWFSALRLYEKVAQEKLRPTLQAATELLLKDLKWKVYFEAAQVEDRAGRLEEARRAYVRAAEFCPANLEWKVWFGGSRTELAAGNTEAARMLIERALQCVPPKMRPAVILEQARLEEYAGCPDAARRILDEAKVKAKHEWKVFLERVLLEIRAGDTEAALAQVRESLLVHAGTGRLWAVFIQLKQPLGLEEQSRVFRRALREVPKSGEVWCEGARIYIKQGKHAEARDCLAFAAQFTPQYGDSFIEYLHNELAENGKFSDPCPLEQICVNAEPNYGPLWLYCKRHPLDSPRQVLRNARQVLFKALVLETNSVDHARLSDVNQMYFASKALSDSDRMKLVFGSDQMKP